MNMHIDVVNPSRVKDQRRRRRLSENHGEKKRERTLTAKRRRQRGFSWVNFVFFFPFNFSM